MLDLTAKRAQMDWYIIGDRADRKTDITYETSYRTLSGTSTVFQVSDPVA
ncbi:hypothetical protein BH09ACT12_BH09ACT12_28250 [soil metagenome]